MKKLLAILIFAGLGYVGFSQCNNVIPGSLLGDGADDILLRQWLGDLTAEGTLIYRKSVDGASSTTFHNLCDNQGPTIVLIKEANTGVVFGGYASASWDGTVSNYTSAPGSFLFNLTDGQKTGDAGTGINTNTAYAIYNRASYGPTFGGGHDLYMQSNMTNGYTNLGYTYACFVGGYGSTDCRESLTGVYNYVAGEVEVYAVSFNNPIVVDNDPPVIICPNDITVNVEPFTCSADVNFADPVVTDNCATTLTQTAGLSSGSQFPIGVTTNTFSATDQTYTVNCSFTVTVTDDPVAVCKDLTVEVDGSTNVTLQGSDIDGVIQVSQSLTFEYTGSPQTWTVPNSVTSINIICYGAQGGDGNTCCGPGYGGLGGYSTGQLGVTPGQILQINVGGAGVQTGPGGFNGGGQSGTNYGASGGGASDVRTGSFTLNDRVIVAGGGGGASFGSVPNDGGAGGGSNGSDGTDYGSWTGGGGGTQTAGGLAGCCYNTGQDGGFGYGGGTGDYHNAGGGGGWYGGGTGAAHASAGGGSGYIGGVTGGTTSSGIRAGNGLVIISFDFNTGSYDNCEAVNLSVSPSEFTCSDVGTQVVTLTVTNDSGNSSSCTANVEVTEGPDGCNMQAIPTLSEWGLIIFTLLLLCFGTVAVWNGRFGGARAEA